MVSASDLGKALVALAAQTARDHSLLTSHETHPPNDPVELSRRTLELLIIVVFPIEVLAVGVFREDAPKLRESLRAAIEDFAKSMRPAFFNDFDFTEVRSIVDKRFAEYGAVLVDSGKFLAVSFPAATNVVGFPDPELTAKIAVHFELGWKYVLKEYEEYELLP
jgi:hypothetical protein